MLKRILSFLSLALLLPASFSTPLSETTNDLSFSCLVYDDLSFYDLRPLQNKLSDYSVKDPLTHHNYTFNLCSYTHSSCSPQRPSIFAYKTQTSICTELTDSSLQTSVVEAAETERHVRIRFGSG